MSKTDAGGGINATEGYTCNAANMLLSRAGSAYTNDADGNTLTGGGRTNTWDSQNRLVTCVNGATTSNFVYGSDGIRHQATIITGGTTTVTDSVLDNSMLVREQRAGANFATYFVGARGPEYRRDDTRVDASSGLPGIASWYLYDGLGSVLGEIDPNGNSTSSRKYDVYGLVRGGNNLAGTSSQKYVGSLGHTTDDNTGLIYMCARYYDQAVGRFASQDPSFNGLNWYIYCCDDPINRSDPSGREGDPVNFLLLVAEKVLSDPDPYRNVAATLTSLYVLINQLRMYAGLLFLKGGSDVSKGEALLDSGALSGSYAGIVIQLGIIRVAYGAQEITMAVTALLGIHQIQIAIQMLEE